MLSTKQSRRKYIETKLQQRIRILVITNSLLILIATLFPFNFSVPEKFSIKTILQSFHHVSNPLDFIANILLFISFGFLYSWLLQLEGFKGIKLIITIVGISVGFSTMIEVLQVFLLHRFSTKADILTNGLGGFLGCFGFLVFCWCLSVFPTRLRNFFRPKHLLLCLTTYLTIIICITTSLSNSVSFVNWNMHFSLVIGNEATGDRPWYGSIAQLVIYNRAFLEEDAKQFLSTGNISSTPRNSLLGYYLISGSGSYQDITKQLPVLAWQGQSPFNSDENQVKQNIFVSRDQWLATSVAPRSMIEKIRQTSQFTLCTTIATAELKQSGPARIISLSNDPYNRNFTLAQEDNNLIFRLRTPLMGKNGGKFKLSAPNVFTDTNDHRLVISYSNSIIKIYLDDLDKLYQWQLMPEAALFRQLFFNNFDYEGVFDYKNLFYLVTFIPLGLLLALFSLVMNKKSAYSYLFIPLSMILTAVISQILLSNSSPINLVMVGNFLLSISIATITFLTVRTLIFLRLSSTFN